MTAFVRTSIDDGELEMNLNKKGTLFRGVTGLAKTPAKIWNGQFLKNS